MNRINADLIASLADDLQPVQPMRAGDGYVIVAAAFAATIGAVALFFGLRVANFSGAASPYFYITNGLLALLGLASATSVITMASPRVGNRYDGPRWAMAMVCILPLVAIMTLFSSSVDSVAVVASEWECAANGLIAGLLTAGALFIWLRRGAPVSPKIAGLHLGVAAGALGSVAYGLHCPTDSLQHLGLMHVAPTFIAGVVGRSLLPRLLRW